MHTFYILPKLRFSRMDDGQWKHDLYDPELQKPKAPEEIVKRYGYNIRQKPLPPIEPRASRGRSSRFVLVPWHGRRLREVGVQVDLVGGL